MRVGLFRSVFFILLLVLSNSVSASPNALWRVVNNLCVFNARHFSSALPCESVNLADGPKEGYAIVRDFKHPSHFLLVPTQKISGIESPVLLKRSAPDYFGLAWRHRTLLDEVKQGRVPRSDYALAINSVEGRSQDQLHIHISCIKPGVRKSLQAQLRNITPRWQPLSGKIGGFVYYARRLEQGDLSAAYPFLLLKKGLPVAQGEMQNYGLAVVAVNFEQGKPGFVVLTTRVGMGDKRNIAHTEGLLDFTCGMLSAEEMVQK